MGTSILYLPNRILILFVRNVLLKILGIYLNYKFDLSVVKTLIRVILKRNQKSYFTKIY